LFSGHPLALSLAIFFLVLSILVLQPTRTPEQKRRGQYAHAILHLFSFCSLVSGVAIIELNKGTDPAAHFKSFHAYLGVIVLVLLLGQYFLGFTMWATPGIYGGVDKAKVLWRYHRIFGYVILALVLTVAISATWTGFISNVYKIKTWYIAMLSVFVFFGAMPRVRREKLGFT
jgi:cytochrome b-561